MPRAFVAVGSNISPDENVARALRMLSGDARIAGVSTVYRTRPMFRPDQQDYYNCVIVLDTDMPPMELKGRVLRRIEDELGRKRTDDKHAPRTIDLDLIAYDELTLKTEGLTLPDPEIASRPFLSIPLCELAPHLELPGLGRADELAQKMPQPGMEPLAEYTARLKREFLQGTAP